MRHKNANKYNKPTAIRSINPKMKTVSIENKTEIPMDNLKRPMKMTAFKQLKPKSNFRLRGIFGYQFRK